MVAPGCARKRVTRGGWCDLWQDPKIASQRRERKKLLRGTHRERQIASRNHDQSLQQRGYLPDRRHRNVPHIWFRIRRGRRWVTPEIHREDKTHAKIGGPCTDLVCPEVASVLCSHPGSLLFAEWHI